MGVRNRSFFFVFSPEHEITEVSLQKSALWLKPHVAMRYSVHDVKVKGHLHKGVNVAAI